MKKIPALSTWARLATLGGLGYCGKAPGTNGSVAGVLLYLVAFKPISERLWFYFTLGAVLTCLACWVCDVAEKSIGRIDPSEVILDECVAMPFAYLGVKWETPFLGFKNLFFLGLGFLLFRFFDIFKPLGIRKLQKFKGGIGIVIDDIAAAFLTAFFLGLIQIFWENVF